MRKGEIRNYIYRARRRLNFYWNKYIWRPLFMEKSGNRLYKNILQKKSQDSTIVFTGPGLGDTLYAMAYINDYQRIHPGRKIIIIAPLSTHEIINSYGGGQVTYYLKRTQYNRLRSFYWNATLSQKGIGDCIFNTLTPFYRAECDNPENLYQLRTHVFGLNDNAKITYHNLLPAKVVTHISDFESSCKRIVLFNLDSNSYRLSDDEKLYFGRIADYLIRNGYIVYCNLVGEQLPLDGTLPLRCDLHEFLAIAHQVPLIVSVRSGILDLLAPTNINMFISYSHNSLRRTIYSMANWGCGGQYKEVCYDEIKDDINLNVFNEFAKSIHMIVD